MTLGLGINISLHGKERAPTNAWEHIKAFIVAVVLLYYSGFFEGLT